MKTEKDFPNGFESWTETHHEIVEYLTIQRQQSTLKGAIAEMQDSQGSCGMWVLAIDWTDEFELKYQGKEWGVEDDVEYFDVVEEFCNNKNLE